MELPPGADRRSPLTAQGRLPGPTPPWKRGTGSWQGADRPHCPSYLGFAASCIPIDSQFGSCPCQERSVGRVQSITYILTIRSIDLSQHNIALPSTKARHRFD
jgi:hypothetical protein